MQVEIERDPKKSAEIAASLARFGRDDDELIARYDEFLDAFPEEWVSIYEGRVFHDPDSKALHEKMRAAGVDPAHAPQEFVSRSKLPLLL